MLCLVRNFDIDLSTFLVWVHTATKLLEVAFESVNIVNVTKLIKLGEVRVLPFVRLRRLEFNLLFHHLPNLPVVLLFDPFKLQLGFFLVSLVLQGHYFVELLVHELLTHFESCDFSNTLRHSDISPVLLVHPCFQILHVSTKQVTNEVVLQIIEWPRGPTRRPQILLVQQV